jgi:hypothetical protein
MNDQVKLAPFLMQVLEGRDDGPCRHYANVFTVDNRFVEKVLWSSFFRKNRKRLERM